MAHLSDEVNLLPQFMKKNCGSHRFYMVIVCRLNKSIYGLEQASMSWFEKFTMMLQEAGFMQFVKDYSLFAKYTDSFTSIFIFMGDIVIIGFNPRAIQSLQDFSTPTISHQRS